MEDLSLEASGDFLSILKDLGFSEKISIEREARRRRRCSLSLPFFFCFYLTPSVWAFIRSSVVVVKTFYRHACLL